MKIFTPNKAAPPKILGSLNDLSFLPVPPTLDPSELFQVLGSMYFEKSKESYAFFDSFSGIKS
jgi:hypothetical protein